MNTPLTRLIARALIAGLTAFAASYNQGGGSAAVTGAVTAGILAAAEILSPVNPNIGLAKKGYMR